MKKFRLVHLSSFLNQGVDLLFWLSFEAHCEFGAVSFGGTLNLGGFYFAYNPEIDKSPAIDTFNVSMFQYDGGRIKYQLPIDVPQKLERDAHGKFV